jgi:hypothetical protein
MGLTTQQDIGTEHVLFVLDESGSMSGYQDETMKSYNSWLDGLTKENDGTRQPSLVSVYLFNSGPPRFLTKNTAPSDVPKLSHRNYKPDHSTALLDTLGIALEDANNLLKGNDSVILVILTDGQENASRDFTKEQIDRKIKALDKNDRFSIVYLSSDIMAVRQAHDMLRSSSRTTYSSYNAGDTQSAFIEINEVRGSRQRDLTNSTR